MNTIEEVLTKSTMAWFWEVQSLIRIAYHLGRETAFAESKAIISRWQHANETIQISKEEKMNLKTKEAMTKSLRILRMSDYFQRRIL